MAEFPVNPNRLDPYKAFKFRVKWDGAYVAAVSWVSELRRVTAVIEERSGADPSAVRLAPGVTRYEPLVLRRGLTQDRAFRDWADLAWKFGAGLGSEVALGEFRKEITLELYNEAGQLVIAYRIHRAWVSQYQALPALDAQAGAVAIESITLEYEGFERDDSVVEPREP